MVSLDPAQFAKELDRQRPYYRQRCDELFNPSRLNDRSDENVLEYCKALMTENGIPNENAVDEDIWLEFVYRANELIAIREDGYCYIREAGRYVLAPKQGELVQ